LYKRDNTDPQDLSNIKLIDFEFSHVFDGGNMYVLKI
jgi:hypothetical protein